MVYIFYGPSYKKNYNNALNFALKKTKNPIIINEKIINYNKEDIELFLYYFSLPASESQQNIIIIENPENIKELLIQSFLFYFENLPPFHTIILVTNQLQKIQKTITSRALLFFESQINEEDKIYKDFISQLKNNNLLDQTIENIIDLFNINETNTIDASIILLQECQHLEKEINYTLKQYLPFIKNSYYLYWKIIHLILHKKNN